MQDDAELLHRYVAHRDNGAFTALVHRHLGLVYNTALRRVGFDTHLAEDASQKVFVALARKAPSLRDHTTLAGWLYVSAHAASAELVRTERRRKSRETEAHTMQTTLSETTPATDWERLRPTIDEIICELPATDREAIVLRFFNKHTFAETGAALRLTEEAARKRVDRSLDKLRAALERRGIKSTSTALGLALAEGTVVAAPAGLALHIVGLASVAAVGATAAGIFTFASALKSPFMLGAAASILGVGAVLWVHRSNENLRTEIAELDSRNRAIPALQADNQSLRNLIKEISDLRVTKADLPALRAAANTPQPVEQSVRPTATITLTSAGTLMWNNQLISLDQYLERLKTFRAQNPGANANVQIRCAPNVGATALAYVMSEAKKAKFDKTSLENFSGFAANGSWF